MVGPVGVFFAGLWMFDGLGVIPADADWSALARGWGGPTATDIVLAWLVARTVFGAGHPSVNFLLLLAVADDAIGLGIIAVFYGDPGHPAQPLFLLLVLGGVAFAWGLRRAGVARWWPYVFVAGPISWVGLNLAHLHPALALVPIIPLIPGPRRRALPSPRRAQS